MNKYGIFKFLLLLFTLILLPLHALAQQEYNILSNIAVEPLNNHSYTLNLYFDNEYTGSAFLNQTGQGSYTIFIPDTTLNKKLKNPVYDNKNDKRNIKINIEEKPYIKNNAEEKYVKLTINMRSDYSLKLVKKTIDEDDTQNSFFNNINYGLLSVIFLIGFIAFITYKFTQYIKNSMNYQSNMYVPQDFVMNKKSDENKIYNLFNKTAKLNLPDFNFNSISTSANNKTFPCFEIQKKEPEYKSNKEAVYEINSNNIKQKPKKTTNPIYENSLKNSKYDESTELDLPFAEKESISEHNNKEHNSSNIISLLKITPKKGFFISTVDDEIVLFGYINETTFSLKRFKDLSSINLQARLYDKYDDKEVYIVRLDSYKAMVEINNTGIRELAVL